MNVRNFLFLVLVSGSLVSTKSLLTTILTVKDLSECFNDRLHDVPPTRLWWLFILVVDTHGDDSLKSATRNKRRQGKEPVHYQARDNTHLKHTQISSFFHLRRLRLTWPTILLQKPRPRSTTVHHTNWWSPLLQETPGETDTCFNSMAKSWRGRHTVDLLGCPSITAKSIRCTDSFFSPDVLVLVLTSCWRSHPFPWCLGLQR